MRPITGVAVGLRVLLVIPADAARPANTFPSTFAVPRLEPSTRRFRCLFTSEHKEFFADTIDQKRIVK
jgi:hypothetical protein